MLAGVGGFTAKCDHEGAGSGDLGSCRECRSATTSRQLASCQCYSGRGKALYKDSADETCCQAQRLRAVEAAYCDAETGAATVRGPCVALLSLPVPHSLHHGACFCRPPHIRHRTILLRSYPACLAKGGSCNPQSPVIAICCAHHPDVMPDTTGP